jgi:hypothetical protein
MLEENKVVLTSEKRKFTQKFVVAVARIPDEISP